MKCRACSTNGGKEKLHVSYWSVSQKEKRLLRRVRIRWVDNNKLDLVER
jgi:hypothetical protein